MTRKQMFIDALKSSKAFHNKDSVQRAQIWQQEIAGGEVPRQGCSRETPCDIEYYHEHPEDNLIPTAEVTIL